MNLESGRQLFAGKNCLVTGGAGFIGSHLARRLVEFCAHVDIVDNMIPEYGGHMSNLSDIIQKVRFHDVDVRNRLAVQSLLEPIDLIFNLAGQTSHLDSMTDPWTDLEINARAQLDLLESIREVNPGIRVVFASTRQIYGRPDYLPVDENHPLRPVDVNGINKIAGESYHLLYGQVYGIAVSVLRLTNTYGPGMRVKDARQTFLGTWIKSAVDGDLFRVFGDGTQKRDFNYVEDAVDAFLLAATEKEAIGKTLNLGSDEVVSLGELAKSLSDLAPGSSFELIPFPEDRKAIDIGDYYSDWGLAASTLKWEPRVGLEEGLSRTLDYFRNNRENYW